MKLPLILVACLGAASALPAQAACYTVYLGNSITYRSTTAPVDLSRPYSETLPLRFGSGASMITTNDETGCIQVVLSGGAPPEGISRGRSGGGAVKAKAPAAPASLDAVFVDPSLRMRSSVGVSDAASGTKPGTPVPLTR
jgi:hypothetical protein